MARAGDPREDFHFNTIRRLQEAASKRFVEAELLADHHHCTIAIYLFGYSAEMLIKSACFQLQGYGPHEKIEKVDRVRVAAIAAAHLLPPIGPHDLFGWAKLLFAIKELRHRGRDLKLFKEVVDKTQVIAKRWNTEMRYEPTDLPEVDLATVRTAATWIRSNHERMMKA